MSYEQENLLEKFIKNARTSKMWTIIGVLAFSLISVSVVYIAKEVKPNRNDQPPVVIHDTVSVIDTDTVLKLDQKLYDAMRDSFINAYEIRYLHVVDSVKATCPPVTISDPPPKSDTMRNEVCQKYIRLYLGEKARANRFDSLYRSCLDKKSGPVIYRVQPKTLRPG